MYSAGIKVARDVKTLPRNDKCSDRVFNVALCPSDFQKQYILTDDSHATSENAPPLEPSRNY